MLPCRAASNPAPVHKHALSVSSTELGAIFPQKGLGALFSCCFKSFPLVGSVVMSSFPCWAQADRGCSGGEREQRTGSDDTLHHRTRQTHCAWEMAQGTGSSPLPCCERTKPRSLLGDRGFVPLLPCSFPPLSGSCSRTKRAWWCSPASVALGAGRTSQP